MSGGQQMRKNQNNCLIRDINCVCLCVFFIVGGIEWAESSERGPLKSGQKTVVSAPLKQASDYPKSDGVAHVSRPQATSGSAVLAAVPAELCAGHGEFNGILMSDWEAGLDAWSVGTPSTFDTPDWEVVGSLPDGRPGSAAFVANLDSGDCNVDDQSGALTLDSPLIQIPANTLVPRISVDHWIATEFGYDGGNFKISVNGSGFQLIPKSAIDLNPYNSTLISFFDTNTNPLAEEDAFTGADNGQSGEWKQSHINLVAFNCASTSESMAAMALSAGM